MEEFDGSVAANAPSSRQHAEMKPGNRWLAKFDYRPTGAPRRPQKTGLFKLVFNYTSSKKEAAKHA